MKKLSIPLLLIAFVISTAFNIQSCSNANSQKQTTVQQKSAPVKKKRVTSTAITTTGLTFGINGNSTCHFPYTGTESINIVASGFAANEQVCISFPVNTIIYSGVAKQIAEQGIYLACDGSGNLSYVFNNNINDPVLAVFKQWSSQGYTPVLASGTGGDNQFKIREFSVLPITWLASVDFTIL